MFTLTSGSMIVQSTLQTEIINTPVVQLDRAFRYGRKGQGFESSRECQYCWCGVKAAHLVVDQVGVSSNLTASTKKVVDIVNQLNQTTEYRMNTATYKTLIYATQRSTIILIESNGWVQQTNLPRWQTFLRKKSSGFDSPFQPDKGKILCLSKMQL